MSSSRKSDLRVDWATHAAAKYACEHWHYSRTLPVGKLVKVGAWESGKFIGVVLFCWGMNRNLVSPYGLQITEGCELVRVALTNHANQVTRIIRIAIAFLKNQSPGLRLVVSFADSIAGHHGGIYQGGNWIYTGLSSAGFEWRLNGTRLNKRAYTGENFGSKKMEVPKGAVKVKIPGKHRYLMPLDDEMRAKILPLAQPYPKRPKQATPATSGEAAGQNRPGRSNLPTAGMDEPA
jgi:hypothetical protein